MQVNNDSQQVSRTVALAADWHVLLGRVENVRRPLALAAALFPLLTDEEATPSAAEASIQITLIDRSPALLVVQQSPEYALSLRIDCSAAAVDTIRSCVYRRVARARQRLHRRAGLKLSWGEARLSAARAIKQCADALEAVIDRIDALIVDRRLFDEAPAQSAVHLREYQRKAVATRHELTAMHVNLRKVIDQYISL